MSESSLLNKVTDAFRCLPGVGPKSAQRMMLYLLERDRNGGRQLAALLGEAMDKVGNCDRCRNFTENPLCNICDAQNRDVGTLCVVETPADVIAIEQSGSYRGLYFVLLGTLSPIDGRGPDEIGIDHLVKRCQEGVEELILAISSSVEGEATTHYIAERLADLPITVSKIAQGVPLGGELEYIDGSTLTLAIEGRKSLSR